MPEVIDDNIDYVCFTDAPRNTHGLWKLRISPYYHTDPVRSARYVKTHPHSLLSNYDFAVWIDANLVLRTDSKKYFDILKLNETNIGLIPHPYRDCFYQEADTCRLFGKDDKDIIDAQINFYNKNGIEKFTSIFETGFMVINLTDVNVQEMFRIWWQQIAQFSRRDQLGLVWALHQTGVSVSHLLPKGVSVRDDDDFRYFTHAQVQEARIPPALKALKQIESPVCDGSFYDVKEARLSKIQEIAIDIVICVYNAIDDVKLCLESVNQHLIPNHHVIIVNDCSDQVTTDYLRSFADNNDHITLIENEENLGYTKSANVGLISGVGDFCILLNSDTIVSQNWAVKMLDTAMQMPDIGIVGALSNAAGAQSVPDIYSKGNNTVINLMPDGFTNSNIDDFLERISPARNVLLVQLVHGFCICIKREVIETIGVFDDVNFARYYGEENDYCFRAATAGFSLAIATNTFVFHRKSQSISEEERIIHMDKAGKKLRELYGVERIRTACSQIEQHPLLKQIRIQVKEYLSNGLSQ